MSAPIRVVQVFAKMNRGGAETMIMNIYRNIDRSKVQFDFIVHTNEECDFDEEIKELGGKIFRVPKYVGTNHFNYMRSFEFFFKEHPGYKLIHGHVRSTAAIYLEIARKYGVKTIAHSHSTSSGNGLKSTVKNVIQFPIRNTADYLFACSEKAGEWLFGQKVHKKNNYYILNNAIDTKELAFNEATRLKMRKELNIENKFVIGHVGRFHYAKNHDFLIDIFKSTYERNENSVLVLVGEGELKRKIEKKVNDLGLTNNVIFTGVRSDIPDLLQAMDIFVFPSIYEGLGIATIEAQASSLPCIVSNEVPDEVLITDSIRKYSINKMAEAWAEEILKLDDHERNNKDDINRIIKSGYDINTSSKWLVKFYLDNHK